MRELLPNMKPVTSKKNQRKSEKNRPNGRAGILIISHWVGKENSCSSTRAVSLALLGNVVRVPVPVPVPVRVRAPSPVTLFPPFIITLLITAVEPQKQQPPQVLRKSNRLRPCTWTRPLKYFQLKSRVDGPSPWPLLFSSLSIQKSQAASDGGRAIYL